MKETKTRNYNIDLAALWKEKYNTLIYEKSWVAHDYDITRKLRRWKGEMNFLLFD